MASTLGYSLQTTITLPGTVGGHGDWVTYDASTGYVWLVQSPDNNVVVINTATNQIVSTIPNIGNGNGIALTPNYAFVADVTNNQVDVINKSTFAVVTRLALPTGFTTPDSVTYIPNLNEIAVASDDANQEVFINASTLAVSAPLQLTPNPAVAGPDVSTYVPQTGFLYQPDDNVVDVINPSTQQIVATWTLLPSAATGSVKPGVYDPVTNTIPVRHHEQADAGRQREHGHRALDNRDPRQRRRDRNRRERAPCLCRRQVGRGRLDQPRQRYARRVAASDGQRPHAHGRSCQRERLRLPIQQHGERLRRDTDHH